MKIYLCGQKSFGAAALSLLRRRGMDVVGVSAPPLAHGDRVDALFSSARTLGIPLLPAGRLNADLLPPGVDLIVCAHSHDFIGRRTREKTRLGAIGYHPSLLPLHRGRDAVKWTIRSGDRVAGGSIYWLNDTVDGGPIAAQDWCFVAPGEDASGLWRRELFPMGLRLLSQALADIERGVLVQIPQDAKLATWEPALNPPSLSRPDLPMLTDGRENKYKVVASRDYLRGELGGVAALDAI